MAFRNIKRPYEPVDFKTLDDERGYTLRHLNPNEGMNSQGYIEMVFETPGGNLEFDAYKKLRQRDPNTGVVPIQWKIRAARWIPPKANISEKEIKLVLKEALEAYGFLFEKLDNQEVSVEFETKQVKGMSSWH